MAKELDIPLPEFINLKILEELSDGKVSEVYKVEKDGKPFVVKGYPTWFLVEDISFIHGFSDFLRDEGIENPSPILLSNGSKFVKHGRRAYSIYEWIADESEQIGEFEKIKNAGTLLGKIHSISKRFVPSKPRNWWMVETYDPKKYFSEIEDVLTKERTPADELLQIVEAWHHIEITRESCHDLDKVTIHGNFEPEHVLLSKGISIPIDLDNCRLDIRELDLADPLRYFCGFPNDKQWREKARIFLSAYSFSSTGRKLNADGLISGLLLVTFQELAYQYRQQLKSDAEEHKDNVQRDLKYLKEILDREKELRDLIERIF